MSTAVHVDVQIDGLADAQIAQFRLFEIRVDPDLAQRADRHQILTNLHVIARIDVPARHDAVNVRADVAVTQIKFSLSELAFGEFELGLGLFDGRSLGLEPSKCAVYVALFFELFEHLLRALVVGMDHTKLSSA